MRIKRIWKKISLNQDQIKLAVDLQKKNIIKPEEKNNNIWDINIINNDWYENDKWINPTEIKKVSFKKDKIKLKDKTNEETQNINETPQKKYWFDDIEFSNTKQWTWNILDKII